MNNKITAYLERHHDIVIVSGCLLLTFLFFDFNYFHLIPCPESEREITYTYLQTAIMTFVFCMAIHHIKDRNYRPFKSFINRLR